MILLEIDPNTVRPGLLPLFIILALGVVMYFGFLSMRKQFGKIDIPGDRDPSTVTGENPEAAKE